MVQEPQTLFLYNAGMLTEQMVVDTLNDGPFDTLSNNLYPVILQELPTLENGGASLQSVSVRSGDRYLNENGEVAFWGGSETTMDQLVASFRLRNGLMWSDGTPLTADDSVFGYEVARSDLASAFSYYFRAERTASYVAIDDQTVLWTGVPGYLDPLYDQNFFPPLPRHAYGSLTVEQIFYSEDATRYPLSWGPFRITEWDAGLQIVTERNPYYYRASEGLPYLDGVVFHFYSDAGALLQGLLDGQCDIGTQDAGWANILDQVKEVEALGLVTLYGATIPVFEHLDFNLQPADGQYAFFTDVNVRRAAAHCIDRQGLINEVQYGIGTPPDSFVFPGQAVYYEGLNQPYPFDPALGRSLLDAAGWQDTNGDGVVEKDGQKFSVTYYTRNTTLRQQIATYVAQQLNDNCGIEVSIQALSNSELFGTYPDGPVYGRKFDLAGFSWSIFGETPVCDLYTTSNIPNADNPQGWNVTGFSDLLFDQVCERALSSLYSDERYSNALVAQQIFSDELPSLLLFWRVSLIIARPQVTGILFDGSASSELWNIEQIDVTR